MAAGSILLSPPSECERVLRTFSRLPFRRRVLELRKKEEKEEEGGEGGGRRKEEEEKEEGGGRRRSKEESKGEHFVGYRLMPYALRGCVVHGVVPWLVRWVVRGLYA